MKKLTTSVLAVVLSASFSMVNAQTDQDTTRTQEIEEVVVTALGIKREKKSIGYAAQEISGDNISQAGQNNAVSALSGNVAGVQVTAPSSMGGSTRITMRGISSLTGENRPLIVVDGVPLDNSNVNDINTQRGAGGRDYGDASFDINPDDIESVTVLKGGPAAALYGSRASNGVILYTTKGAKRGRTQVELNTGVSFENIYIYPDLQDEYGGGLSDSFQTVNINGRDYNIAGYAVDESWGPKFDPNLMYLPWYAFDPENPEVYLKEKAWVASPNDVNKFFNTGVTLTNNISVAKSFEKSNLRLSYTNTDIEGVLPNSWIKKNNFSINADSQLSDRFKAETVLNFVRTEGFNRPEQGYGDNSIGQKFFQWGQRQLDMAMLERYYKLPNGVQRTWNRTAWNNPTPKYSDNPYWTVYENTAADKRNRVFGNVGLTYDITDNIYAVGKFFMDQYSQENSSRVAVYSQAQSGYALLRRNHSEYNYEARVHWDPRISDNFSLNTFVGVNRRQMTYGAVAANTVGGLIVPGLYNLSNSTETAVAQNDDGRKRVNSVFGSVSLGFKDTFFLEGTARNDWFSTVTDDQFYPSVTGSFVFSNLIDSPWLSFGKLRAGWAQVASDTDPYLLQNYVALQTPFGGSPRFTLNTSNNNPNLLPEVKRTMEAGIEMSMLRNRLGFDVTYYDVDITDGILPLAIDPSTGFGSTLINAGRMTNKGIEAMVWGVPVRNENFAWDINVNFAKNTNEVVELAEGASTYQIINAPFKIRLLAIEGQPYGQIYGTDFMRDDSGNKVVDANGRYIPTDITNLGSILPDYNMGIRNTLKFKDLQLSFLIDIQKGGKFYSTTHMWGMYSGMLTKTTEGGIRENGIVLEGVKEDGSVNDIVIDAQTYGGDHYFGPDAQNVFNADYVKLRDITLSYNLPKSVIGNTLQGVRISLFGRNLFAWGLDYDGIDPENTSYGSGNIQAIEGGSLPSTRQYGVNVNFKF